MRWHSQIGLIALVSGMPLAAQAKELDFDNVRGGARLSSIDIDAATFDDTVGVGAFVEAPFDERTKFGIEMDIWNTEGREDTSNSLSDFAFSGYGKYRLIASDEDEISGYALAGLGLHFIQVNTADRSRSEANGSFDLGLGFEAKLTKFIALNGEMKFRNVNNHDYNDYGVGVIAKF